MPFCIIFGNLVCIPFGLLFDPFWVYLCGVLFVFIVFLLGDSFLDPFFGSVMDYFSGFLSGFLLCIPSWMPFWITFSDSLFGFFLDSTFDDLLESFLGTMFGLLLLAPVLDSLLISFLDAFLIPLRVYFWI